MHPYKKIPSGGAIRRFGVILLLLVGGACQLFAPGQTPPVAETPAPVLAATAVAAASSTAVTPPTLALPTQAPPTEAPTTIARPTIILPVIRPTTSAPPRLATAAPALPTQPPPAPTHPDTLRLKIFLIAIGDNGQSGTMIGCGDSLIPVNIDVPYTQGVLRAALEHLLAIKDQYYGQSGLYNALYQSNLRIDGLKVANGEAVIELSGQPVLGGECDTPRVIAQLEATALQFSTVQRVSIFLNGEPIRSALSLRG